MAKHRSFPVPPPTRIRVATANAATEPLTGGLLAASAGTAGAADSVTHRKEDFDGEGYADGDGDGDVAFCAGPATASGQENAGDFVALYGSVNGITSAKPTTIGRSATSALCSCEAGDGFGRVRA
ncbi:hypothetical protein [Streptomyces sp. VRA16 Mangrove soil]|uniref:hypothetical protein n=1 Tax=Streptomyces sp. VRA16 Mangrove soil TaxID=2817434 RepID=UPI001A9D2D68|nr:hypothetical protein [Streptomyces sp. VRA16 Mangrove soil]MBO1332659.1 hypothetical protein [Streptomyces sp. VRA16 Mangrove soil]